eukprot:g4197.t1
MGVEEVADVVRGSRCRRVVLTGGEPLLQEGELVELMEALRSDGEEWFFEMETNGTRLPGEKTAEAMGQFNVSPKLANSGMGADLRLKPDVLRGLALTGKAWFKFVVQSEEDIREVLELAETVGISRDRVILMPEGRTVVEIDKTASWLAERCRDLGVRFSDRQLPEAGPWFSKVTFFAPWVAVAGCGMLAALLFLNGDAVDPGTGGESVAEVSEQNWEQVELVADAELLVAAVDHLDQFSDQELEHGVKTVFSDGKADSRWVVLDYIDVMVHVMHEEMREFYGLEELWADAKELDWETFCIWAAKNAQLRDRSKAKTWLFTTLHREFLGQRRKMSRFSDEPLDEAMVNEAGSNDDDAERQMDGQRAVEILADMDEMYQIMDKERAKFVLQSFRPDGADSEDADFAEALKLATSDRELGEWLMRERAFDAEFAEAMARVELPKGLVENVLLAMAQDNGLSLQVDKQSEGEMIEAIASIPVPEGLRERVLESMERSAVVVRPKFGWVKVWAPVAAAAGIAFGLFIMERQHGDVVAEADQKVSIDAVQAGFVRAFESPIFSLDERNPKMDDLMGYLRSIGLPCGEGYLPKGLTGVDGVGCRELIIDGKRGSLICFDEAEGTVHFVVFRKEDVAGDLPDKAHPRIVQDGNWAKAAWEEDGYAFCLMGMRKKEKLASFF